MQFMARDLETSENVCLTDTDGDFSVIGVHDDGFTLLQVDHEGNHRSFWVDEFPCGVWFTPVKELACG